MLGCIRTPILDFICYFVTAFMRKYPIHVTSAQCEHKIHYASLEASKQFFMITYNSNYTQKMFQITTMKNDRVNI